MFAAAVFDVAVGFVATYSFSSVAATGAVDVLVHSGRM